MGRALGRDIAEVRSGDARHRDAFVPRHMDGRLVVEVHGDDLHGAVGGC